MGLDQDVHAPGVGGRLELERLGVGDAGEDDEDAVGAEGAAFGDLPGVVEEVLAEDGQGAGVAGEGEVAVVALEARARRSGR